MINSLQSHDTSWGFDGNARDRVLFISDASGDFEDGHANRTVRISIVREGWAEGSRMVGACLPQEYATAFTQELRDSMEIIEEQFTVTMNGFTDNRPGTAGSRYFPVSDLRTIEHGIKEGWLSRYHPAGIYKLGDYPFNTRLRRETEIGSYDPRKAVYYTYETDALETRPGYLNLLDLPSTMPVGESDTDMIYGPDIRRFLWMYVEFTLRGDGSEQPLINPAYAELEVLPQHWGHVLVMDSSKSRAHMEADLTYQLRKIHPQLRVELNTYETAGMLTFDFVVPYDVDLSLPYLNPLNTPEYNGVLPFGFDGYHLNTRQGRTFTFLGHDNWSRGYSEGQVDFEYPALALGLPGHHSMLPLEINVGEGLGTEYEGEFVSEHIVTPEQYGVNPFDGSEISARISITNVPEGLVLKRAEWIFENEEEEGVEIVRPAYLFRRLLDLNQEWNGQFELSNMTRLGATIWDYDPDFVEYIQGPTMTTSPIKASVPDAQVFLHVAPPPQTDGSDTSNISPFHVTAPKEGKLRLVFDIFISEEGVEIIPTPAELKETLYAQMFENMELIPIHPSTELVLEKIQPEGAPFHIEMITTDLLFNWDHFAAPYSLYVKRDTMRPLLNVLSKMETSDDYNYEGATYDGYMEKPLNTEEVLNFVNEKGEFIYPTLMFKLGEIEAGRNEFFYHMNTMGPEDIDHQTVEGEHLFGLSTPYISELDVFWDNYAPQTFPVVIGNVGGDVVGDKTLDIWLPFNRPYAFSNIPLDANFNTVAVERLSEINIEITYDVQTDELTIHSLGGDVTLFAINRVADSGATDLVLPADAPHSQSGYYTEYVNYTQNITRMVHKTVFAVHGDWDSPLLKPPAPLDMTFVELPEFLRASLEPVGGFEADELTGFNLVIGEELDEFGRTPVSLTYPLVYEWATKAESALRAPHYWGMQPCPKPYYIAARILDPRLINLYRQNRVNDSDEPMDFSVGFAIDGASLNYRFGDPMGLRLSFGQIVEEEGVEVLYLPINISSIHRLDPDAKMLVNFTAHLTPDISTTKEMALTLNVVQPVDLVSVTQENASQTINVKALLNQAVALGQSGAYDGPHKTMSYGGFENITQHTGFTLTIDPMEDWFSESVGVKMNYSTGDLSIVAGLHSENTVIVTAFFEGATLGDLQSTGPFNFYQLKDGVMLVLKFEPVVLPVVTVDQSPLLEMSAYVNSDGRNMYYSYQLVSELVMPEDRAALSSGVSIRSQLYIGADKDPQRPWDTMSYTVGNPLPSISAGVSRNAAIPSWIPYFNGVQPNQPLRARLHAFVSVPWKRHYVIKKLIND